MTERRPLRIALFTHSVNPRGGVVHVLELAEAMSALGHAVVVHAPAEAGRRFFREVGVEHVLVPAHAVAGGLAELVRQRVSEYVNYLEATPREFDVYHAHDGISGNALATLTERGAIGGFIRTVHHVDDFADPIVREAEARAIRSATNCLCVSQVWRGMLRERYGVEATVVPNGVDLGRFTPERDANDDRLSDRLGALSRPVFLAVGGVERRKNTANIARAFVEFRRRAGRGSLLIIGGASLLDHSAFRREFEGVLAAAREDVRRSVRVTGTLPDALMPAAYRFADALAFPSVNEGFGLAALEAMACGTPVITSRLAPFTEYLTEADALLVDPHNVDDTAAAMNRILEPARRIMLRTAGFAVASRFTWAASGVEHERVYHEVGCAAVG